MNKNLKKKLANIVSAVTVVALLAGCSTTNGNTNGNETVNETTNSEVSQEENTEAQNNKELSSSTVDTGQKVSYDMDGNIITPAEGGELYGQDAQYAGTDFSFTDNGDGTVTDNNTGLMWQVVPSDEVYSWEGANEYTENLELAGYDDWRTPSAEELFSLSDFETGWPYLDTDYFDFPSASAMAGPPNGGDGGPQGGAPQGDSSSEGETDEMVPPDGAPQGDSSTTEGEVAEGDSDQMAPPPMDASSEDGSVSKQQGQFWTSNYYKVDTEESMKDIAFGVNHATGHIKAYPAESEQMGKYVRAVRGSAYGESTYVDNGDGTITDESTGLMWMQDDSGEGVEWDTALSYAENMEFAGYDDWRLPDVKELQSIVDYSGVYPAIDDTYFNITELEENVNYYFWTNTSAYFSTSDPTYGYAWYVAFGYAVGNDNKDSHGAGAVRFSPKYEESASVGEGGDNVFNSVRLVRSISE